MLAAEAPSQAYKAWDEIDLAPQVKGMIGLMFSVTRHSLLDVGCACGHVSRALPWRAPADAQWEKVELGEWRLAGVLAWPGSKFSSRCACTCHDQGFASY